MKIQMRVQITGTRNGVGWPPPSQVVELPDYEAAKLCAAGLATPVVEDPVEKAVAADDAEKRTTTKTGPARRK